MNHIKWLWTTHMTLCDSYSNKNNKSLRMRCVIRYWGLYCMKNGILSRTILFVNFQFGLNLDFIRVQFGFNLDYICIWFGLHLDYICITWGPTTNWVYIFNINLKLFKLLLRTRQGNKTLFLSLLTTSKLFFFMLKYECIKTLKKRIIIS